MMENLPVWFQIALSLAPAVGAYAAIKADLAVTRNRADAAHENAASAHSRIDSIYKSLS